MFTAFAFSSLFLVSYLLHHYLHAEVKYPAEVALLGFIYLPAAHQPHRSSSRGAAVDSGDIFLFAQRTDSATPQGGPLDLPAVALRLYHRCRDLGRCCGWRKDTRDIWPQANPNSNTATTGDGTRQLLQWGSSMLGAGLLAAATAGDRAGRLLAHRRQYQHRLVCPYHCPDVHSLRRFALAARLGQVAAQPGAFTPGLRLCYSFR